MTQESPLQSIRISHIWVHDQDEALDFYVGKLGLEVSADLNFGPMRWLTVRVPGDPTREILLERPAPPSADEDAAGQIRELVAKGASGFAAGFTTQDARKTYDELVAKGVEITDEPTDQPYGIDFGFRDPFGNQLRISQMKPGFPGA